MQVFYTVLPMKEDFKKDKFVRTVIHWVKNSRYPIRGATWDGENYTMHFEDGNRNLSFIDLPDHCTIGSRFEQTNQQGTKWTVDCILNYQDKRMVVKLDRAAVNEKTKLQKGYSMPYIVKLVIRNGWVDKDNDLDIISKPFAVTRQNHQIISKVILGQAKYMLPIVYITKTRSYDYPVDPHNLSVALQGCAHVLKEEDPLVGENLRYETDGQNPYGGYVAIYYPSESAHRNKLNPWHYKGPKDLEEDIVFHVDSYMNQQGQPDLYTFDGIYRELQRQKYGNLEKVHEDLKQETDEVYAEYDKDSQDYSRQIEKLKNQINKLESENSGLRAKLNSLNETPLLISGNKEEFFDGEARDFVLDVLNEAAKSTPDDSRRKEIIDDILEANNYDGKLANKSTRVKTAVKGYTTMTKTMRRELEDLGFTITSDGKHYKLTYYGDDRYVITMAKTGSDYRGGDNLAALINKKVF